MSIIPKIIYYCWFGSEKPEQVIKCIQNWKEQLPEYEIVEINDKNKEVFDIENEYQNNLWFKTVWENKMWAYVADYARLKVLSKTGGVYFDTDITVEKDITELLNKNKLILGWEDKASINFAVCITPKDNKIINNMLKFYEDKIWHSKLYTIPHITSYILNKNYNLNSSTQITENEDIIIFPSEYFYPIPVGIHEKANFVTDKTYTIHWWDGSWTRSNIDYFMRNKHKIELEKLLKQCFEEKIYVNNSFLKIRKTHKKYTIELDWYYSLRFKYRYYGKNRFLTVLIFGIQIRLIKIKGR